VSTSPSVILDADDRFTMFYCGWVELETLSRLENGEVEWISLQRFKKTILSCSYFFPNVY